MVVKLRNYNTFPTIFVSQKEIKMPCYSINDEIKLKSESRLQVGNKLPAITITLNFKPFGTQLLHTIPDGNKTKPNTTLGENNPVTFLGHNE